MQMVEKIVGIAVALIVVASIFPMALAEIGSIDTTSIPSATVPLLTVLLPVLAVIGVVMYIVDRT